MKYDVGDIVQIKKDLDVGTYYNHLFVCTDMEYFFGKTFKVQTTSVYRTETNGRIYLGYILESITGSKSVSSWTWNDDMLENAKCTDCNCFNTCNKKGCEYE